VPESAYIHLFVARGQATLEGIGTLQTGDTVRISSSGGQRIVATEQGAEVLIWEMHATLG
jgi:hypothetical protein